MALSVFTTLLLYYTPGCLGVVAYVALSGYLPFSIFHFFFRRRGVRDAVRLPSVLARHLTRSMTMSPRTYKKTAKKIRRKVTRSIWTHVLVVRGHIFYFPPPFVGVVVYVMLSGFLPFSHDSKPALFEIIRRYFLSPRRFFSGAMRPYAYIHIS